MKIGILTYHRVVNDGSVLQAYCVQKALSRQFPEAKVEIIDYSPSILWWTENLKIISKRPPFIKTATITKMKSIQNFINNYLVLSSRSCSTDDLKESVHFIENQGYDAIFVGSDTVWEARYSNYAPVPPNIYYLPNLNSVSKISYAASADPINPDFISDKKLSQKIANYIKDFDHITVRDETTTNYLNKLGVDPKYIHFMPDPTLQYDFEELVQQPQIQKKRPWAAIGFSEVKKSAASQFNQKGYDIVDLDDFTLNGNLIPGAVQSVKVRLGVFALLDFLITDRFHSSIFTLKLAGSPVVFIESSKKWPEQNSKGRDLFQRMGLEEMVWRYVGQEVPKNLIDRCMDNWEERRYDLDKNINLLYQEWVRQINTIAEKI